MCREAGGFNQFPTGTSQPDCIYFSADLAAGGAWNNFRDKMSEAGPGAGMSELEQVLAGDSAHTPPAVILEGLASEAAHREVAGAPRTIYEELWHIAFWQQMTLDWIRGIETAYPVHDSDGFPTAGDAVREDWDQLRERFFKTNKEAGASALDADRLDVPVRCPSRPGMPVRTMTVREQLESLAAHNAYHFGRIVLLRQLLGLWPPPSGGFSW
jgi:uncharacterized damage-inducible protein DinB